MMKRYYSEKIEQQMKRFYQTLSEKERRRYAGVEAIKLGYGGISYICSVLGCDYQTVIHGMNDLDDEKALSQQSIRQSGGGRKPALTSLEGLEEAFLKVMAPHTAGSPMEETLKWSPLSRPQIAERLQEQGFKVSVTVVDQLLEKHHFHRRQAVKTLASGPVSVHRDEQFENISRLQEHYQAQGNPVLSMDVKKKKL